jgi:hypothetical protein
LRPRLDGSQLPFGLFVCLGGERWPKGCGSANCETLPLWLIRLSACLMAITQRKSLWPSRLRAGAWNNARSAYDIVCLTTHDDPAALIEKADGSWRFEFEPLDPVAVFGLFSFSSRRPLADPAMAAAFDRKRRGDAQSKRKPLQDFRVLKVRKPRDRSAGPVESCGRIRTPSLVPDVGLGG